MTNVHFSDSFIEFLKNSECKIAQLIFKMHLRRLNHNRSDYKGKITNIITPSEINYITFRRDGTISYLPAGKECLFNDSGDWSKENRQNGKPSKVIRKLFSDRSMSLLGLKDKDFECFTNSYKSMFNDDGYKFELLENKKIPSVYEMERGHGEASLNGSCMNNDSEYLSIYKNCEALKILILTDKDGLLHGRALVWTIGDIVLIDRIYVTKDFLYDSFLDYAKSQKWWRKEDYKSYDSKQSFVTPDGEKVEKTFKIFTNTDFDQYPYIDTFCYGGDGVLTNCDDYTTYTYNETNGERDGGEESGVYDAIDGCYIDEDSSSYVDRGRYSGDYTHYDNTVNVNDETWWDGDDELVKINGTYYVRSESDEIIYLESSDCYALIDDTCYSEMDNEYYMSDDCVYIDHKDDYCLRENATQVDGKWYVDGSEELKEAEQKLETV